MERIAFLIKITSLCMQMHMDDNENVCLSVYLSGYGFVDFDSPAAAQKAVASLKANGVQAQMAKVRVTMFIAGLSELKLGLLLFFLRSWSLFAMLFFLSFGSSALVRLWLACVLESCVLCDGFCPDILCLPLFLERVVRWRALELQRRWKCICADCSVKKVAFSSPWSCLRLVPLPGNSYSFLACLVDFSEGVID